MEKFSIRAFIRDQVEGFRIRTFISAQKEELIKARKRMLIWLLCIFLLSFFATLVYADFYFIRAAYNYIHDGKLENESDCLWYSDNRGVFGVLPVEIDDDATCVYLSFVEVYLGCLKICLFGGLASFCLFYLDLVS